MTIQLQVICAEAFAYLPYFIPQKALHLELHKLIFKYNWRFFAVGVFLGIL